MIEQMTRHSNRRKGSFSIEYGALMAITVAAGIGMSVYFMRSLCGRWRQVGDTFGAGKQYEPGKTIVTTTP